MNTQPTADALVKQYALTQEAWDAALLAMSDHYPVYAPVKQWNSIDYALIDSGNIPKIVYNTPKPVSPLKLFLLPVKENVVLDSDFKKPFIVMGAPACDIRALDLLDCFYMDADYVDPFYRQRREQMILIGSDCHSVQEHCHCTSYGVNPYPEKNHDLILSTLHDLVFLEVNSIKGDRFIEQLATVTEGKLSIHAVPEELIHKRKEVKAFLEQRNKQLPNSQETSNVVKNAKEEVWAHYAKTCVSCGACATICPTCTCFLLIDRPGFEKVKQMDACQYPGFQRVAGGEDPQSKLHHRFKNRYMCKYVFRPEKFDALACTGCGRCIEACIGQINKNKLFVEVSQ